MECTILEANKVNVKYHLDKMELLGLKYFMLFIFTGHAILHAWKTMIRNITEP